MILKTEPAICQSSVIGDKLLFVKVKLRLTSVRLAETRAVLVDIMVIMGRQIMLGVKLQWSSYEEQLKKLARAQARCTGKE